MPRDLFAGQEQAHDLFKGQAPVGMGEDALRSLANGLARGFPKTGDFLSAGAASLYDNTVGNGGDYFDENLSPRYPAFNKAADAVFGQEYEPQHLAGKVAQFGGELISPGSFIKGAKNAAGFARGLLSESPEYITDSAKLVERYKAWKASVESTPITGPQIAENIRQPFMASAKRDLPYATKEGLGKVQQLNNLSKAAGTDLGYVYGLRRSLGAVNDNAIVQPMREAIDSGLNKFADKSGLGAYRRYKVAENVDDATRNFGNETVKATRTKLNNLDKTGMTGYERQALQAAGRGTATENLLRLGGRGLNALTSAATGISTGSPSVGLGMYGAGRGLEAVADRMAGGRIESLRGAILNGRSAPNMGERFGTLVRGKAQDLGLAGQQGSLTFPNRFTRAQELGDVSVSVPSWLMDGANATRFSTPLNTIHGDRISGFADDAGKVLFGYDKNGELFTKRVNMLLPDELVANSQNGKITDLFRDRLSKMGKGK